MSPSEAASLFDTARDVLGAEVGEFTLEANPVDDRTGFIRGWREAGVTRLSVGVQSFDEGLLRTLGRSYTAAEALAFCGRAKEAGFDALSIDLMIGVPGETDGTLQKTLDAVRGLEPDHVSAYFLENVEGLPFEKVMARRPVDEDAAVDHYQDLLEALESLGLHRYEISNFAKPGKECRHNLKYWRYEPYLGLGPSACSHVGHERWCNKATIVAWADALGRGHSPRGEDAVALTPTMAAREALVFGLRLVQGVDVADLEARTGVNVCALYAPEIDELASDGLLVQAGARLWIPADKLLVSNAILSRFI